jgi:hypothetical protein
MPSVAEVSQEMVSELEEFYGTPTRGFSETAQQNTFNDIM